MSESKMTEKNLQEYDRCCGCKRMTTCPMRGYGIVVFEREREKERGGRELECARRKSRWKLLP